MELLPAPEREAASQQRDLTAPARRSDHHEHRGHDLPPAELPAERHHGVHRGRCVRRIRRGTGLNRPSSFCHFPAFFRPGRSELKISLSDLQDFYYLLPGSIVKRNRFTRSQNIIKTRSPTTHNLYQSICGVNCNNVVCIFKVAPVLI